MKKPVLLVLLFLIYTNALTQQLHYIAGTVKDESGKPLSGAELFLAGTSRLSVSDENGNFSITRLPAGNYELVAKLLGRETYSATFTLSKPSRFNITLKLKSQQLEAVVIRPKDFSNADFNTFARTFLGSTPNAAKCKILNPKVLNIFRDPETGSLHVNSGGEFLIIANEALGYNVKYLLEEFVLDNQHSFSMYMGQAVLTEMPASESKAAKWKKERSKAYLGSPQHLLRSLYHDNLKAEGFVVRKLLVTSNSESISEKEYVKKQKHFESLLGDNLITRSQYGDSLSMIARQVRMPGTILGVGTDTLQAKAMIDGHFGPNKRMNVSQPLHIVYLNERPAPGHHGTYFEGTEKGDYRYQMSTISSRENFVPYIDPFGNLLSPLSVIFNGYMGWERIAEMLPKDFVNDNSANSASE